MHQIDNFDAPSTTEQKHDEHLHDPLPLPSECAPAYNVAIQEPAPALGNLMVLCASPGRVTGQEFNKLPVFAGCVRAGRSSRPIPPSLIPLAPDSNLPPCCVGGTAQWRPNQQWEAQPIAHSGLVWSAQTALS